MSLMFFSLEVTGLLVPVPMLPAVARPGNSPPGMAGGGTRPGIYWDQGG